jgi:hypothetical protein
LNFEHDSCYYERKHLTKLQAACRYVEILHPKEAYSKKNQWNSLLFNLISFWTGLAMKDVALSISS